MSSSSRMCDLTSDEDVLFDSIEVGAFDSDCDSEASFTRGVKREVDELVATLVNNLDWSALPGPPVETRQGAVVKDEQPSLQQREPVRPPGKPSKHPGHPLNRGAVRGTTSPSGRSKSPPSSQQHSTHPQDQLQELEQTSDLLLEVLLQDPQPSSGEPVKLRESQPLELPSAPLSKSDSSHKLVWIGRTILQPVAKKERLVAARRRYYASGATLAAAAYAAVPTLPPPPVPRERPRLRGAVRRRLRAPRAALRAVGSLASSADGGEGEGDLGESNGEEGSSCDEEPSRQPSEVQAGAASTTSAFAMPSSTAQSKERKRSRVLPIWERPPWDDGHSQRTSRLHSEVRQEVPSATAPLVRLPALFKERGSASTGSGVSDIPSEGITISDAKTATSVREARLRTIADQQRLREWREGELQKFKEMKKQKGSLSNFSLKILKAKADARRASREQPIPPVHHPSTIYAFAGLLRSTSNENVDASF